jgi:Protein of unknown function (DUF1580)
MVEPQLAPEWISITTAAGLFPRPVSADTVSRYSSRGLRRPDGTVVKLRCVRFGGRLLTTEKAVREFVSALAAGELATMST